MRKRVFVVCFALGFWLCGCAVTGSIGGKNGVHVAAALAGSGGYDASKSRAVATTWGHGNIIVTDSGASSDRKGISDNLQRTLGDDLGIHMTDAALCGFVPTSCIGQVFDGDDGERAEIIRRLRESRE